MPINQTPKPIDILSLQLKELSNELKIMKCDIINLKEQLRIKEEKFEIVQKPVQSSGWLWQWN